MLISERIAEIIEEMLEQQDGTTEIQRNDFANKLGCVPSQINYVISSRFNKQHGYIVESRRGGGGYIRITKVRLDKSNYLMQLFGSIGDMLSYADARVFLSAMFENDIIDAGKLKILLSILSDDTLYAEEDRYIRDVLRANILKTAILNLM